MKHIIIIGGGFGGVECFRRLNSFDRDDIRITLINKKNYLLFTPMLHEVATGSVSREDIVQPLREIVAHGEHRFMETEVTHIDCDAQIVRTKTAGELSYDYLVIAVGGNTAYYGIEGAKDHAFPLKTMDDAITMRNHVLAQFEAAAITKDKKERSQRLHFVIVGGGLTGVEMAGQLADFTKEVHQLYPEIPETSPKISLIHAGDRLLPALSPISGKRALQRLKKQHVDCHLEISVKKISPDNVLLSSGEMIDTKTVMWATGYQSALPKIMHKKYLDTQGKLPVENNLRMVGYKNVFGVGDVISWMDAKARPPSSAQAATQAGRIAADNIAATIDKKDTKQFRFISKGDLVPIGEWYGVAEIGGFAFHGKFAWWLRRTVFILRLSSWSDRIRVMIEWTIKIFRPRDTSQL